MSCHRLLRSIIDTRTVADGTDTSTKADRVRATTGHRAEPLICAADCLADLGRVADQIGGSARRNLSMSRSGSAAKSIRGCCTGGIRDPVTSIR
jgi:hypothetical protein